jgi:hypothetical protein
MDTYKMNVVKLIFDWFYVSSGDEVGEESKVVKLNEKFNGKLVTRIDMYSAAGEGDKWYFDILFEDNTMMRTFNPNQAFFEPDKCDKF